ncbi:hypothetical protein [Streptomyces longwoodensis]|nr:hypothetical protein [Streptomyces longwoodensis]MCX5000635.1 hypothetical protein [Streptomyces longwoodensis]
MTKPPRHRLVPTRVAALAVGVSEATIRKWVSRGKITRYGAPNCRSEFDIEELQEIALRRRSEAPDTPSSFFRGGRRPGARPARTGPTRFFPPRLSVRFFPIEFSRPDVPCVGAGLCPAPGNRRPAATFSRQ